MAMKRHTRWLAGGLLVLTGALALTSLLLKCDEDCQLLRQFDAEAADLELTTGISTDVRTLVDLQCNGKFPLMLIGTDPVFVNRDGQCKVFFQYPDTLGICFHVKQEGSDRWEGPFGLYCPNKTSAPNTIDVEYIRAVTPFKARIILYPRGAEGDTTAGDTTALQQGDVSVQKTVGGR